MVYKGGKRCPLVYYATTTYRVAPKIGTIWVRLNFVKYEPILEIISLSE